MAKSKSEQPTGGFQATLRPADLAPFPSLALPEGWFPHTEDTLKQLGLWSDPVRISHYERRCWEGRCADQVTLIYG